MSRRCRFSALFAVFGYRRDKKSRKHVTPIAATVSSLGDVLLVEESVGGGFGDVFGPDVGGGGQVGNGAGQLYDAGAGSGGQAHVLDDFLQKMLAVRTQRAVFLDLSVVH